MKVTQGAMDAVAMDAVAEQQEDEKNLTAELLQQFKEMFANEAEAFIKELKESNFIDEEITFQKSLSWGVAYQGMGTKYENQNDSVNLTVIKNIEHLTIEQIAECLQQAIANIQKGCDVNNKLSSLVSTLIAPLVFEKNKKKIILTANLGDSRAVFIDGAFDAQRLTCEHSPEKSEKERIRITAAGGEILGGRLDGFSAISRGIGSLSPTTKGFSHEPELSRVEIAESSTAFVAAYTDGINLHDQQIAALLEIFFANKIVNIGRMEKAADFIRKLAHVGDSSGNEKADNKTIALISTAPSQQDLTKEGLFCVIADGSGDESFPLAEFITAELPKEFQKQINRCLQETLKTAAYSKKLAHDSPVLRESTIQAELKKLEELPKQWQLLAADSYFYLMLKNFREHQWEISPKSFVAEELRSLLRWMRILSDIGGTPLKDLDAVIAKGNIFSKKNIEESSIYTIYQKHFYNCLHNEYISKNPVERSKILTFMREKFSAICELKFGGKLSTKDVSVDTLLDAIIYAVKNTESNLQQKNIGNLQK